MRRWSAFSARCFFWVAVVLSPVSALSMRHHPGGSREKSEDREGRPEHKHPGLNYTDRFGPVQVVQPPRRKGTVTHDASSPGPLFCGSHRRAWPKPAARVLRSHTISPKGKPSPGKPKTREVRVPTGGQCGPAKFPYGHSVEHECSARSASS